jgi:hypothetical protein
MRRRQVFGLVVLVGLVAVPAAVRARGARAVRMQMDGYVGAPPEGHREQADLTLGCGKAEVRFQVTRAVILSGGGLASKVFDHVKPYRPNFRLQGPEELRAPLCTGADGTRWEIAGTWTPGTRNFLVASLSPQHDAK